jgi:branched-chain amino acid transport system permease protein
MDLFAEQVVNSLVLRSMCALIALGYAMVCSIINLVIFAHGEVLMIDALTSWAIVTTMQESLPETPGWFILIIALVSSCVVAAVLNFTIEKVACRPRLCENTH